MLLTKIIFWALPPNPANYFDTCFSSGVRLSAVAALMLTHRASSTRPQSVAQKKTPDKSSGVFFRSPKAQHLSGSASQELFQGTKSHSQSPQNRPLSTPHHQSIHRQHPVSRRFLWHFRVSHFRRIKSIHPRPL